MKENKTVFFETIWCNIDAGATHTTMYRDVVTDIVYFENGNVLYDIGGKPMTYARYCQIYKASTN